MIHKNTKLKAFTLVELIVVIVILAILGTIAFIAMQWYSRDARDSARISDLSRMKTSLELFHLDAGKFPETTTAFSITYSGANVWNQGTFGEATFNNVTKLDAIPLDPLTEKEYTYSVTNTKQEYQLGWIMESSDFAFFPETYAWDAQATAIVTGNYNGKIVKTQSWVTCEILSVPSIISNQPSTTTNLVDILNNQWLVYNGYRNLPSNYLNTKYDAEGWFGFTSNKLVVYSDNSSCSPLLDASNDSARNTLLENLKVAYKETIIWNDDNISEVTNFSPESINLVWTTLVNNTLWWKIDISKVSSGLDISCSWVTWAVSGYPDFDLCSNQITLNYYGSSKNTPYSSSLTTGKRDVYWVYLDMWKSYTIKTIDSNWDDPDTVMFFYDKDGNWIAENDDCASCGNTTSELVGYSVTPWIYYFWVMGYWDNSSGIYDIDITYTCNDGYSWANCDSYTYVPPFTCTNASTPTDESYFTFNAGTKTITDYNTGGWTDVVIPCSIGWVQVANIWDYAFDGKWLTSVVLPEALTTLSEWAFYDNLFTTVDIPDSVTTVWWYAFYNTTLNSVTLWSGVQTIWEYAFYNSNITSLTLPTSLTTIEQYAFNQNAIDGALVIPDNVTTIRQYAFAENSIDSITLWNSLQTIEWYAFWQNQIAGTVTLPNSLTSLLDWSFYQNSISGLTIGSGLSSISQWAFANNSLTSLTIPATVTTLWEDAFSSNSISSLSLTNGLTTISSDAFSTNSLTTVTIPSTVTTITWNGWAAFHTNPLTSVVNYDGNTSTDYIYTASGAGVEIEQYFWWNTSVTIPSTVSSKSVVSIWDYAFQNLWLTSVTIPSSATFIWNRSFHSNSLTSIVVPSGVTVIDKQAFTSNSLSSVTLPNTITSIWSYAFGWQSGTWNGTVYWPASPHYVYNLYATDPGWFFWYFDLTDLPNYVVQ